MQEGVGIKLSNVEIDREPVICAIAHNDWQTEEQL